MSLNAKGTEMETIEYRTVDKSAWGAGPWQDEPDKVQWQDETTGLPCLIVRGPVGALCGYVGVSEAHPWFKLDYTEVEVDVHWGLTFASMCQASADESRHICHKPAPGEPDHVWWFGFDCAHCDDYAPAIRSRHGDYRDLAYVRAECASLARQLAAIR